METKKSRFERFCWFLAQHQIKVLVLVLGITAVFGVGISRIHTEVVLSEMFPYDHPYLKLMGRFGQVFGGGGSGVVIAVKVKKGDIFNEKTLTKIKNMTSEVELWDEVYRVLTVSMASNSTKVVNAKGKGEITIEALMFPDVPKTPEAMELLKKNVFSNPAYNGSLVSKDGTACLLVTECKENISYSRIFTLLRALEKKYSDENTSIHVVGFPMLMGWIYSLTPQMYMVFGFSVLAIALVLWLIFDNFPGMISPLANAGILTIWGLGFIGFTGINFSPLLYVLAFLVAARMIGNSHQIAYRYFEELDASKGDRKKASYETMRTMWVPNFAAVAADVAGFAVLFIAKIVLMVHLAIIMSFWMATILCTGLLVPLVCSLVPQEVKSKEWAKESCQLDRKAQFLMRITQFSIGPRTRYITGALILLLTVFCVWETSKLKIGDPTSGSPIFFSDHPYNKDQAVINKAFDVSSENFVLYYEGAAGSVYDPVVLSTFESFSRHMAEQLPDIYKSSSSILNIVSMLNLTFHDGDMLWYQLPLDKDMLTGILGYIRNTVDRGTLGRFMDSTLERAQITLYFADHTSDSLLRIRNAAYDFFRNHPMKIGIGEFHLAGGRIGMEIAVNEEMKRSHLLIDLAVYLGILVLCSLCFRSIVAGLMLTVPLLLANSMAATYMSIRDIGLSINTLPIAAIGAGLGVDFAIYLYSRAMEEFPLQKGDWAATIMQSVCTCGKAVVYTGITVILPILTWYFFSDMKFQAEVGFFLSIIMAANVVLALTLHPLMIYIIKPKFISQNFSAEAVDAPSASLGLLQE
ncbi:MAG: efflux RND transporter permease subunit [Desulfobacteria bacterium]